MKLTNVLVGAALSLGAISPTIAPATAFDFDLSRAPERPEVITHRVYHPHYVHVYRGEDPYKYRYERRAYYPYAGSHYWRPAAEMRNRYRYAFAGPKYRYHPSWGFGPHKHAECAPVGCPITK